MNQTHAAEPERLTPTAVQARIKQAYLEIGTFVVNRGTERLRARWPEWDKRFREIFERTKEQPEVTISLVGGTGAGKSTLLNALIWLIRKNLQHNTGRIAPSRARGFSTSLQVCVA